MCAADIFADVIVAESSRMVHRALMLGSFVIDAGRTKRERVDQLQFVAASRTRLFLGNRERGFG